MTTESDDAYFRRRAQQSLTARNAAADSGARMAHDKLAKAYARRAGSGVRDGSGDGAKGIPGHPAAAALLSESAEAEQPA